MREVYRGRNFGWGRFPTLSLPVGLRWGLLRRVRYGAVDAVRDARRRRTLLSGKLSSAGC